MPALGASITGKTQPRLREGVSSRDYGLQASGTEGGHSETRLNKLGHCETLASRNYRQCLPIIKSDQGPADAAPSAGVSLLTS